MKFIEYPKCSTCKKAKKYLDDLGMNYIDVDIVSDTPCVKELEQIIAPSGESIHSFFNTSGLQYRALNLKDKLLHMSDCAKLELLAQNGMLIKRPLLVGDSFVLKGFRVEQWDRVLNNEFHQGKN